MDTPLLKKAYERLLKIRGEPREIAFGFALGIFVGMSPTMGLQILIAVFFAALFKWNKISAAVGVFITNPLTAPFIYSANYFVGAKIYGLKKNFNLTDDFGVSTLSTMIQKTPRILYALIIGGVVLGLPLAVAGYYFSFNAVRKYREDLKQRITLQKAKFVDKRKKRKRAKKKKA
jgi:uncharacterized protein (DUF2062 family)